MEAAVRRASSPRRFRPRRLLWLGVPVLVVVAVLAMSLPVPTRQGVDFVVSTRALPLYVKVLDFVDRDVNYRDLARRIAARREDDEARALAVLDWTRVNIRNVPAGFPIVDDHVWHIIVRGYGLDDQKADVFTTLATYAGVRSYWIFVDRNPTALPVTFAFVSGRWRVLDVERGFVFRVPSGEWATADDVRANPSVVTALAGNVHHHGRSYADFFTELRAEPPATLRAEKQMPLTRLLYEAKRALGLGRP